MKKCLFLGYKRKDTSIISNIEKERWIVREWGNKKPNKKFHDYDLIISFGYKNIIKRSILDKCKNKIINLHISYLPHNRGAHPNFWSFINNTPKGVSIHEMNTKIDEGNLIYRKKIKFKKNIDNFELSYKIFKKEIEKLFIKKIKYILNMSYKTKKINDKGSLNLKKSLPIFMSDWKVKISTAKKLIKLIK